MDYAQSLRAISRHYCIDEWQCIHGLLPLATVPAAQRESIEQQAMLWVEHLGRATETSMLQDMLDEYALDTQEGQALMVLAESLLRIPDSAVANALIADQLQRGDWQGQGSHEHSLFVQTSSALLEWTGHWLSDNEASGALARLLKKFSAPVVHRAMLQMIRLLAGQFVFAETIDEAVLKARAIDNPRQTYSFDMLGEAAVCEEQSQGFFAAYLQAINSIGGALGADAHISIKLSALSPRFETLHWDYAVPELVQRLEPILSAAVDQGVAITLDAEEANRLELMLAVFSDCFSRWGKVFAGRFGVAVQAYSTRALPVLSFLDELAQQQGAPIAVRLVKGAYWDTEIKQAQVQGLSHFPVFSQKRHTDLSYLACAKQLLSTHGWLLPQFATHNPVTISHILAIAKPSDQLEFQRLHGMGEALYKTVLAEQESRRCRVYSPVGDHRCLLPYLVRRILENGANNSFVRQMADSEQSLQQLCRHPLQEGEKNAASIRLPLALFGDERRNSSTINLASFEERENLKAALQALQGRVYASGPVVAFDVEDGPQVDVSQAATGCHLGSYTSASPEVVRQAISCASESWVGWNMTPVQQRAQKLQAFAQLLETHRTELLFLLMNEAGKTVNDAINEWREASDFCYYYAAQAVRQMSESQIMPGPDGEHNALYWEGRGVFLCISPWNFPLAIFVGQVAAALVAGNTVLAKPAEQTSLIACRVVSLMHEAGFPVDVIQCLPGEGEGIAGDLLADPRLAGVAFTGSLATAQHINRRLAEREAAIIPLIAETGGQNAMIVDSSALPEQVVRDVLQSAFYSAGQRCSAMRVLFLQQEIYAEVLELLLKAIATLRIGNPEDFATDIGPVISEQAAAELREYIDECQQQGRILYAASLPQGLASERFVPPHVIQLDTMQSLGKEHFGPLLHVRSFAYEQLDEVIEEINACAYGLTAGVHSRDQAFCQYVADRLAVGNVYLNREMTGAVVGVQPFGGRGLSGTGPKAGGPHYLRRFATEKTVSNNIAAIGGSVNLLINDVSDVNNDHQ